MCWTLEANRFDTLPIDEILEPDYPYLDTIASVDQGDYLQDIYRRRTS